MPSASGSRSCTSCAAASGAARPSSVCVLLYRPPLSPTGARAAAGPCTRPPTASRSRAATCELRGPGEFLGARQSGVALLRFADLERDAELVEAARDLRRARCSPTTRPRSTPTCDRWLGGREEFLKA